MYINIYIFFEWSSLKVREGRYKESMVEPRWKPETEKNREERERREGREQANLYIFYLSIVDQQNWGK
jgi:hypothetical protein